MITFEERLEKDIISDINMTLEMLFDAVKHGFIVDPQILQTLAQELDSVKLNADQSQEKLIKGFFLKITK